LRGHGRGRARLHREAQARLPRAGLGPRGGRGRVSARAYRDFEPTFAARSDWTLPWILRERARTHGEKTYLEVPDHGVALSFAETLAAAERLAAGLLADGGEPGDRFLIMCPNRAEVILAWFGSSLAGMAEVPINTAYSG